MNKILNFGSINIDKVYKVKNFVSPGETIESISFDTYAGGKGLNQSIAAAKAGGNVFHAGCIGEDGLFLKKILLENFINTDYVMIKNECTGHAVIQIDENGQNSIIIHKGANNLISKEDIENILDNFSSNDLVILQNEISNISHIINESKRRGLKVALNPSPITDELFDIDINSLDYIILNEIEAISMSNTECLEDAIEYFKRNSNNLISVITLGEKGAILLDKYNLYEVSSIKVNAVDTTAAGDTFTGYLLALITKGLDFEDGLKIACKAAGICVTRKGASTSIPSMNEVNKFCI